MNKLKFLIAAVAILVSALGIYSCAKDETKNEQKVHFTTENRNALPSVINSILHFDPYSDFQTYATIWVKDGEIGCRSKHFGKNFLGIWVRMNLIFNTTGLFANIEGDFKKEVSLGNCIIINQPFNEKKHPGGDNASWQNIISKPGINFIDSGKLSSGHKMRLKAGGNFFGFGVDRPRIVLD